MVSGMGKCCDKHSKLRKKYDHLRKKYKKLLGVAIELTQVVEEYVRGERSPNVTETLELCSNIYPSLFDQLIATTLPETKSEEMEAPVTDDEKEYVEGFSSRPKLPRTPLNSNQ